MRTNPYGDYFGDLVVFGTTQPEAVQRPRRTHARLVPIETDTAEKWHSAVFRMRNGSRRRKVFCARIFFGREHKRELVLLDDRVAQLAPDGEVALYVHKLTRVLDRDGIQRYGEVAVPPDSDILELRTIQPDGSVAEPEISDHKDTVSMPVLSPGNVIEQEYVQHLSGGIDQHPEAFRFVFGSFTAPIVYSRFVVFWPWAESDRMKLLVSGRVPEPQARVSGEVLARIWERDDIPQSSEESAMPRADILPTVRIAQAASWDEVRDYYRNSVIESARIGSRAEQIAKSLHAGTEEDKAREILRDVVSRVRAAGSPLGSGDAINAEDTLADGAGSRTAVLLAVARAAGLHADLLLARDAGTARPQASTLESYTRPLVRFRSWRSGRGKGGGSGRRDRRHGVWGLVSDDRANRRPAGPNRD